MPQLTRDNGANGHKPEQDYVYANAAQADSHEQQDSTVDDGQPQYERPEAAEVQNTSGGDVGEIAESRASSVNHEIPTGGVRADDEVAARGGHPLQECRDDYDESEDPETPGDKR